MAPTRLAVVADIHHGRDTFTKRGTAALALLNRFVEDVNAAGCDAVIDLGDRISDESPERDAEAQAEVASVFRRLAPPRHHVNGNHDRAMLSADEIEARLDAPTGTRALEVGPIRVVLWQPDVSLSAARGLNLAPGDLDRLQDVLSQDDRPTLLVSHVPLSGHAQTGNYWFERNPGHATYAQIGDVRRVIAESPCPVVAIAGHVHWNTLTTVDGTPHLTLQSLTETFTTGEPSGTTALLEIDCETLRWRALGLDALEVTLPWRVTKRSWPKPLPVFSALREPVAAAAGG